MSDPVWNGVSWTLTNESNTVTPAESPINADATVEPSNYLICDRSGFRVSVKEGLREEWNGLKVRKEDYETRHPQEFVRAVTEERSGSERPEQTDTFVSDRYPNGVSQSDL